MWAPAQLPKIWFPHTCVRQSDYSREGCSNEGSGREEQGSEVKHLGAERGGPGPGRSQTTDRGPGASHHQDRKAVPQG